jgi:hypothetical protein
VATDSFRGIDDGDVAHYWVMNADDDALDPAADQYDCLPFAPPYATGKSTGFHGNLRKQLPLLDRMRASLNCEIASPS